MAMTLDEIVGLYEKRGAAQYGGEAVSQLEHALQCASLAEAAGAASPLVAASLLHDLGHLLAGRPHELGNDADDGHQNTVLPFLRGVFPDAVLEPIRLHVDAKRHLCAVEPAYWDALSAASRHSLTLQGGRFGVAESERFLAQPYARDAVALRRWDDLAKVPGRATHGLGHFTQMLRRAAI